MKSCDALKGLSKETAGECTSIVNRDLMGRGSRPTRLADMMVGYFKAEAGLLKTDESCHNISSDVIESMFGYFKERKSPNRMYGVTGFVLTLPLHTKLGTLESARKFDFKACLEGTHSADVKAWQAENLPENLASKRSKILRNVC